MLAAIVLVFLSYSSADVETAKDISSRLRAAGCEVWDYREQARPGDDWRRDVEAAMERAGVIMLLISPASKSSEYTQDEWAYARMLKTEQPAKRIVAVPIGKTRPPMIVARFVWVLDLRQVGELCKEKS